MVGNGVTAEQKYDSNALLPFIHGMALISDDIYKVTFTQLNTLSICYKIWAPKSNFMRKVLINDF